YLAINNGYYLCVINDPNILGTACNFANSAVFLNNRQSGIGLPSTIVKPSPAQAAVSFGAATTQLCQKFCTGFTDSSTNNPQSWQWLFPGGTPSSSTDQNPSQICYQVPGVYDVTLITTNASGSDTLTLIDYITVYQTP